MKRKESQRENISHFANCTSAAHGYTLHFSRLLFAHSSHCLSLALGAEIGIFPLGLFIEVELIAFVLIASIFNGIPTQPHSLAISLSLSSLSLARREHRIRNRKNNAEEKNRRNENTTKENICII